MAAANQTDTPPIVVDVIDAAEHLVRIGVTGASVWTIRGLIHSKRLTAVRIGKKDFIAISNLDALFVRKR